MITVSEVQAAQKRICCAAIRTPLLRLSSERSGELHLKLENLQPTGSFKVRGAYNKIASLAPEERARGLITYSSGNHGQAVAYAARAVGARAIVVMPRTAAAVKIERARALGAEIVLVGPGSSERQERAEQLSQQRGYTVVPPFNDLQIIAGQGTIGLEILQQLPSLDAVLVPIGGGGLISGIAAAVKQSRATVRVIGVEPELANDAQQSLRTGSRVTLPAEQVSSTIADGLRTQRVGEINFEHIRQFVDDIVTVSEEEIREATRRLLLEGRILAEPSGAVAPAAWLAGRVEGKCAAVVSGGNMDAAMLKKVL
ncbi:MAG: threonine/serine dehydratase [Acidobacteria bacterium]|nr:threonine/serine dehydratase [Acidobacteriota bacterium]